MDPIDLDYLSEAPQEYLEQALRTLFFTYATTRQEQEWDRITVRLNEMGADRPGLRAIAWLVNSSE